MPIQPQIPLAVQPPPSPLVALRDIAQLHTAQQAQQIGAQRLQMGQMDLEEAKRQRQAQDALDRVWQELAGNLDPQVFTQRLAAAGQGHLIPSVLKTFTDWQAAGENLRRTRLDNTKTAMDIEKAERNYFGSLAYGV